MPRRSTSAPSQPKTKKNGSERSGKSPSTTEIFELKVTLQDSRPPIWRRVEVADSLTLADLHELLQIVMGWTDSHLHQFHSKDGQRFVPQSPEGIEGFGDPEDKMTHMVTLGELKKELKEKLAYEYDFGDGWIHSVQLVKERPASGAHQPVCLAGENSCPPEDCGGIYGYYEIREALADPKHEMHEEYSEYYPDGIDAEGFDLAEVNKILKRMKS